MIATDDKNIGTSGDEFNDSTAKYVLGNAWNGNSYRYTLSKENAQEGETWYARAYLVYTDAEGNVNTIYGKKRIQAEIQIRTLAMNFWATVEHSLQYKYKGDIPQHVTDKLLVASDAIDVLDHEMSTVRDEIMDAQDSFRKKSNLVSEILHTMQNLYKVANRHEVLKIQDEFYKIYETGDMERLEHFNKQLDIIAEGYRAQSIS